MNCMRKIEQGTGGFILYNDTFFVKRCDDKIVWTSSRPDAYIFTTAMEAEIAIEKINKFLLCSA